MAELINRPQYLNQLIQNKDVDLVKIVTGIRRCGNHPCWICFITICWRTACRIPGSFT